MHVRPRSDALFIIIPGGMYAFVATGMVPCVASGPLLLSTLRGCSSRRGRGGICGSPPLGAPAAPPFYADERMGLVSLLCNKYYHCIKFFSDNKIYHGDKFYVKQDYR